jgi:hypothetical protein
MLVIPPVLAPPNLLTRSSLPAMNSATFTITIVSMIMKKTMEATYPSQTKTTPSAMISSK